MSDVDTPVAPGDGATAGSPDELTAALARFVAHGHVLVASDFDGALAEFSTDPADTAPAPGAMLALRNLARMPHTTVAVVSGRDAATLADLTDLHAGDSIALIGSHGAESSVPGVATGHLDQEQRQLLDELTTTVAELIDAHPGARLERKRAAVAVHTRGLTHDSAEAALQAAEELGRDRDDVRVLRGKSVLELSVSHADKGSAISALAEIVGAEAVFYSGDDVTDEDAFAALEAGRDVTVKVGSGASVAAYRVGSVTELVTAIQRLAGLRYHATHAPEHPTA